MIELKLCRLIETGSGSAAWNMALDEALLSNFKEADLPILRLYRWEPSLSLGRFSKLEESVDRQKIEQSDISYVRRMTGGGILVHGDELSYTLILPRKSLKEKGIKESYRHLCCFLIRLYEELGHKADFACDQHLEGEKSDICLATNEAYDIVIKGKKMGGNAQRHTHHALFQHGTIPITFDRPGFESFFLTGSGLEEAATLQSFGHQLSYDELASLVKDEFCTSFGASFRSDKLSPIEERSANELLEQKYTQKRWNIYAKYDRA